MTNLSVIMRRAGSGEAMIGAPSLDYRAGGDNAAEPIRRGLSVIIPSRSASNLIPCVAAVLMHEPDVRVTVVWHTRGEYAPAEVEAIVFNILYVREPWSFSKACNIGIRADGDSDVVLLNDDALLESHGGFTLLQQAAAEHPAYGIIAATTNLTGQMQQWRRKGTEAGLREVESLPGHSAPVVAFVCVLIPRRTIKAIGYLDERFTAYGWEDNDYCRRVTEAGLKIGVHDGCYVDHGRLRSTFRGDPKAAGGIEAGRKIYLEKWGAM